VSEAPISSTSQIATSHSSGFTSTGRALDGHVVLKKGSPDRGPTSRETLGSADGTMISVQESLLSWRD
jgi:hypothetical protein